MIERRPKNRDSSSLRPIKIETGTNLYAEGSCTISFGNTKVHCTASVSETVPGWMEGRGRGWVTAEYSMLPRSTGTRTKRDRDKMSGRTHEIQRLIGRALRAVTNLEALGERSIVVDCDVLQADGGTRTASITGGFVALSLAVQKLVQTGALAKSCLTDSVSAVSIGMKDGEVFTDLDYLEDSACDVDMNFVITGSGNFVEVQGTAEGATFSKEDLQSMTQSAVRACEQLKEMQKLPPFSAPRD